MKKILFSVVLICISLILLSQTEVTRIPIGIKSANGIYEDQNKNGVHCFYMDLDDEYLFVVTDSLFQLMYSSQDNFHSGIKPEFLGSIATDSSFIYFFRKVADNELMVLTVDDKEVTLIKTLRFFHLKDWKLRKYLFFDNRILAMLISKSDDQLVFYEFLDGLHIVKNKPISLNSDLLKKIEKGFIEGAAIDNTGVKLLIHYASYNERLVNYFVFSCDFQSWVSNVTNLPLSVFDQNEYKQLKNYVLSGDISDSCAYILGRNWGKHSVNKIVKYSLSTGSPSDTLVFSPRRLAESGIIKASSIDIHQFTSSPLTPDKVSTFTKYPIEFNAFENGIDTVRFNFRYYLPTQDFDIPYRYRYEYSLICRKTDLKIIEDQLNGEFEFDPYLDYSVKQTLRHDLLGRDVASYNKFELFVAGNNRIHMCSIDNEHHALVIELLDF